ncbi:histidine kinase [Spirosoma pulveris]
MIRPNDKWIRLVGIPLLILGVNLLFLQELQYQWKSYLIWTVVGIAFTLLLWEADMRWLLYTRQRYASIEQTDRRVIMTFAGYLVITAILESMFIGLSNLLTRTNAYSVGIETYLKWIGIWFIGVLLIGTVFEVTYYLQKYRETVQESEAMKKAGLQSQYDSLKNQVNPHFLFNALNSLSALISEDRERAGMFLDELSSVYRYLLQAGQRPLVTLAEEMNFLYAYRYLLDVRFGPALCWNINVDDQWLDLMLPPLTLQTLLENALRLNTLLAERPLTLTVATQPGSILLVGNTLQRKKAPVLAPQGGLTLLAARYESLHLPAPVIEDDGQQFCIRLPLIRKEDVFSQEPAPNVPA